MIQIRTLLALILAAVVAIPAHAAGVAVTDGDTIRIGDRKYRIEGVDAPEQAQDCPGPNGAWRCGEAATARMRALVAGRTVTCDAHGRDAYDRIIATCRADGVDLGATLVREGLAWAFVKYSSIYVAEEALAKAERRGVWSGPSQPAWEYRARRWNASARAAPEGCAIKGNISDRGRIYHTPWSSAYDRTRIDTRRGERWFCNEAEAIAAGWRAPHR